MKTKIALTKEQVDKLVEAEEKALKVKFEREISSLRKKYEVVEIEIDKKVPEKKIQTSKVSDEVFSQYLTQGKKVKEIAELTGYNEGYIYRIKKRILSEQK